MIGNRLWPAKLSSTLTLSYFTTFKLRPLAECPWIRKQMFKGQSPQRLVPWPGPHQLSRTQCFNINIQHRRSEEAESWNLPTRYTLYILVASVASFITAHQLPGSPDPCRGSPESCLHKVRRSYCLTGPGPDCGHVVRARPAGSGV